MPDPYSYREPYIEPLSKEVKTEGIRVFVLIRKYHFELKNFNSCSICDGVRSSIIMSQLIKSPKLFIYFGRTV